MTVTFPATRNFTLQVATLYIETKYITVNCPVETLTKVKLTNKETFTALKQCLEVQQSLIAMHRNTEGFAVRTA